MTSTWPRESLSDFSHHIWRFSNQRSLTLQYPNDHDISLQSYLIGHSILELWAKHQVHVTSEKLHLVHGTNLYINQFDWTFNSRVMGKNVKCTLLAKITSSTQDKFVYIHLFKSTRLDIQSLIYGQQHEMHVTFEKLHKVHCTNWFMSYESTHSDIQFSSNGQKTSSARYFLKITPGAWDK
jgi:hypothetical protein